MSKYSVSKEEIYPDYGLAAPDESEPESNIELTDKEYADFLRVSWEYTAWQRRIADLLGETW